MDMSNHRYDGSYTSAIARARRVLIAAGIPWSKTTGRYHPFANTQKTTYGVRVTRVGCGDRISLHVWGNKYVSHAESRDLQAKALAILRDNGMPFDDRGWLECRRRA